MPGVSPSFKLSFPVTGFTYTTVATVQLVYIFSVIFVEPVTVIVCTFVLESFVIVPSVDVHPPNPYPVGLSINGLSINSTYTFPFIIGHVFLYVITLYLSVKETYPIISGSTSLFAYP